MVIALTAIAAGMLLGIAVAIGLERYGRRRMLAEAEERAARAVAEAETSRNQTIERAKREAAELARQAAEELKEREQDIRESEGRLSARSEELQRKTRTVEQLGNRVRNLQGEIKRARDGLRELDIEMTGRLAVIAGMTPEDAAKELLDSIEQGMRQEAQARLRELETETRETADELAGRILADTVQRFSRPVNSDSAASTLPLSGKELSRVLAMAPLLEELSERTGTTLTLNEESGTIHFSAPDAVNRELAKAVFAEVLRTGGRNRPPLGRIVDKQSNILEQAIRRAGLAAVREAGCPQLPRPIVDTLGRLMFRYSYGQNQLKHAVETAHLAAMLARELHADIEISRAGGLLHDLGKAIDREVEGTHAALGAQLAVDAGLDPRIAHCIEAHHEEIEPATTEALITIIADAASGSRPGARRESLENYLARLEALESVAYHFPGVEKCYAIQAGRELRVIVDPNLVGDEGAARIASGIGRRIEETLEYPGQIKVTVIRETRSVEQSR
jgi:ribonuclease Y